MQQHFLGQNLSLLDHPKMRQRHLLSVAGFGDQFSVSVAVGDGGMSGSFSAATAGNSCCEFALIGNLSWVWCWSLFAVRCFIADLKPYCHHHSPSSDVTCSQGVANHCRPGHLLKCSVGSSSFPPYCLEYSFLVENLYARPNCFVKIRWNYLDGACLSRYFAYVVSSFGVRSSAARLFYRWYDHPREIVEDWYRAALSY